MRRFQLSTGQKTVIWLIGLFLLWRGLHDPFVIEAILSFGLAGTIPGTDIVLSPDQVMLLAGSLIVLVIVVFSVHHWAKRHPNELIEEHTFVLPSFVRPREYKHPVLPRFAFSAEQPVQSVRILHATWMGRITSQIMAHLRKTTIYVAWAKAWTVWAVRVAVFYTDKYSRVSARWIIERSIEGWQWLSPHLWRFDAWLGLQYHAMRNKTKAKIEAHDTASVLLDLVRYGRQSVKELSTRFKRD